ncbi:MAG TPA: alpha/beta fold hydrolase [Salegentibacter sp.]|nr:alpha/beta fold hydrolase [Salegentibacter sp.]
MKSQVVTFFSIILILYLLICILGYFLQEKMIFLPQTLPKDYSFKQYENVEERYLEMQDGKKLHALLFRAEDPKGLIFYLHGNAGSLEGWGSVAETFKALKYDVFIPDYRGYGKSESTIKSELQLHEDMQTLYDKIKEEYPENQIVMLGHSIGSGMAARLAARNDPKLLILQAPPYSLPDLIKNTTPLQIFPSFLLRYKLETGKYVASAKMPVVVLHGDKDEIVYYGSSLKIQKHFKAEDSLITLKGLGHNNFLDTQIYKTEIRKILGRY